MTIKLEEVKLESDDVLVLFDVSSRSKHTVGQSVNLEKLSFRTFEISKYVQLTKLCIMPSNLERIFINTLKYHVFAPMGRFLLELIYLYFSTVLPSII